MNKIILTEEDYSKNRPLVFFYFTPVKRNLEVKFFDEVEWLPATYSNEWVDGRVSGYRVHWWIQQDLHELDDRATFKVNECEIRLKIDRRNRKVIPLEA